MNQVNMDTPREALTVSNLQQFAEQEMTKTVKKVAFEIFSTIKMTPDAFRQMYVQLKDIPLPEADARTQQFFKKMLPAIDEELNSAPQSDKCFMVLQFLSGDMNCRNVLIERKAFPLIQDLVQIMDKVNPNIVRDIISA